MRRGALGLLAAILAVCLTVVPAAAHHVIAAKFDPNQTLTLNGTVVASQSAAQQFNPASAVKLATALVALRTLGPQHRFATAVWIDGNLDKETGVLSGYL